VSSIPYSSVAAPASAPKRFALVDCNNFYVSCERLFRPDLRDKPVAVLSNNDGCIVARSQEVKDLGIKMAMPVYQLEALIKQHRIQLFSSNYALYADISARVMSLLAGFSPNIEIYSIDEAFLDLTGIADTDPIAYGLHIRRSIGRATGIPVCVGMGPTKTLAKLANYAAKKWSKTAGIVDLSCKIRRQKLMRITPVDEVWGIGPRLADKLNRLEIKTAFDLSQQAPERMRTLFSVVLARTVKELNGVSCLPLEERAPAKRQIVCSRSFKQRICEFNVLAEALAGFCCRAAEKLRQQRSLAGCVSVFIRTNPFNPDEPQYQRSACQFPDAATQDTRRIINIAKQLLRQIFRSGYRYQKCAVLLNHLQPEVTPGQLDLFTYADTIQQDKQQRLMQAFDAINRQFPQAITVAAAGSTKSWQYRPQRLSGRYTTRWSELARVRCV